MLLIFVGVVLVFGCSGGPGGRAGFAGSGGVSGAGGAGWSGGGGKSPYAGEDLGEEQVAGWWSQGEGVGVADQAGRDTDQSPAQGGDHGLAVADAVPGQGVIGQDGAGELVEPAGHGGGQQRAPHPGGVDLGVTGGQVAQRGAVLAVAEQVFDGGAVPGLVLG